MGKVKSWLMGMEEDAMWMSRDSWAAEHGAMNLQVYDDVQGRMADSIEYRKIEAAEREADAYIDRLNGDVNDEQGRVFGVHWCAKDSHPIESVMGCVGRDCRGRVGHGTGGRVQLLDGLHPHSPHRAWAVPTRELPSGRYWSLKDGGDIIKNFSIVVHHNADDWGSGESEITEGMSFEVVTVGINNLPPEVKLSIMNPYTCDIDAEIADQIVQTGLFGSPVYG